MLGLVTSEGKRGGGGAEEESHVKVVRVDSEDLSVEAPDFAADEVVAGLQHSSLHHSYVPADRRAGLERAKAHLGDLRG